MAIGPMEAANRVEQLVGLGTAAEVRSLGGGKYEVDVTREPPPGAREALAPFVTLRVVEQWDEPPPAPTPIPLAVVPDPEPEPPPAQARAMVMSVAQMTEYVRLSRNDIRSASGSAWEKCDLLLEFVADAERRRDEAPSAKLLHDAYERGRVEAYREMMRFLDGKTGGF